MKQAIVVASISSAVTIAVIASVYVTMNSSPIALSAVAAFWVFVAVFAVEYLSKR